MIERLCVVGVGLIGGSLARALRAAGACREVVGSSRRTAHLEQALALGVIDRFDTDPGRAAQGADMVVVCTPMGAMRAVFERIAPALGPGSVVTDAGSVKQTVLAAARAAFGREPPCLVPAHPIAGTEHSGVEASFATLFQGRRVIVTPTERTDREALARVVAMWEATGAEVDRMDPAHHDEVLAATSHLPHMLAYTLVDMLGRMQERGEFFRYAAGGFRDFTRIASSDPQMWHDICLDNREAIVKMVAAYRRELEALERAVGDGDGSALFARFERAKRLRDAHAAGGGADAVGPDAAAAAETAARQKGEEP